MQIGRLREPREVEVAHLTVRVVDLLSRDMDDAFLELLERAGDDLTGHCRTRASVANRIVCLCRRLIDQVRRYERMRLCELDPETEEEDDIDF
jgi:hypothetical protein